jgi:PKD repeat protein
MKNTFTIKHFLTSIITLAAVCITTATFTYSGGPPAGNTNAPGEGNCTGCHSGSLQTSGTNYTNVVLSNNFTGGGYIPDSTYIITLDYTHSGKSKFGYQLTCLDGSNAMAGSFSTISGNSKSAISTTTVSGGTRSYMNQTSSGNSGSGAASWSFRWTAPSTNKGTLKFYAVVNSANGDGGTSGDIIIAKEFSIVPSSLLPVATAGASNTNPCQGTAVTLSGSATNTPTSWSWSLPGGSPSSASSQNPSVVYANPGTYKAILIAANAKGYSKPDTVTMVVKSGPAAFIGGGDQTICQGDSVELSTSFDATYSFSWSSGQTTNAIWIKDTGNYSVDVSATNGCGRASNIIHVGFYTKPSATLSSTASVYNDSSCTNSLVTLQASSSMFDSFYYYANGMLIATKSIATHTVSFDSTTIYGLRVRNSTGCKSDLTTYTVNSRARIEPPVLNCTSLSPSKIEYDWSSIGGHNGFEISVNGGNWLAPSSGSSGNKHLVSGLQPLDSVTLRVRALDNAPCFYSEVATLKCFSQACNQLAATVSAPEAVCKGDFWTVEVNGLSSAKYALTLNGGMTFLDTIFSFNPTITTNYLLRVIDSNNLICPAKEISIPLRVDRIGDIELKTNKGGAYCPGDNIVFSANDSLDKFDFYWNTSLVQSGSKNTYENSTMKSGDSLFVVVTKGECIDTSDNLYVSIESPADATFSYTQENLVYSFSPTIKGYPKYTWDFGDGSALSNAESLIHDFSTLEGKTAIVTLEVETTNGCNYSFGESIKVPLLGSIHDFQTLGLEIYPNPLLDVLFIDSKSSKASTIVITNLAGEVVMERTVIGTQKIDVSALAAGIYIVNATVENNKASARFIKK